MLYAVVLWFYIELYLDRLPNKRLLQMKRFSFFRLLSVFGFLADFDGLLILGESGMSSDSLKTSAIVYLQHSTERKVFLTEIELYCPH